MVVRLGLPRRAPSSPRTPINRSTVHRATSMPSRRISSHTFAGAVDRIILGMHTADLDLQLFVAHGPPRSGTVAGLAVGGRRN